MVNIDKWITWPYSLLWFIPLWCVISVIVGLLFGMLYEAGDYAKPQE